MHGTCMERRTFCNTNLEYIYCNYVRGPAVYEPSCTCGLIWLRVRELLNELPSKLIFEV